MTEKGMKEEVTLRQLCQGLEVIMYPTKALRARDETLGVFLRRLRFRLGAMSHYGFAGKNQAGTKKKKVCMDGSGLLSALPFRGGGSSFTIVNSEVDLGGKLLKKLRPAESRPSEFTTHMRLHEWTSSLGFCLGLPFSH